MSDLGTRQATGVIDNSGLNPFGNGNWVVTFTPQLFSVSTGSFVIYHMAVTGPPGSTARIYKGITFYDITPPTTAGINSWDPQQPLYMMGGESLIWYYNTSNTPAPFVTVWLRQPSPL